MKCEILLIFLPHAAAVALAPHMHDERGSSLGGVPPPVPTFEKFAKRYGRTYKAGSTEHVMRRAVFDSHIAEIEVLNSQRGRLAVYGVNILADRTEEELQQIRGYKHAMKPGASGMMAVSRHHDAHFARNTTDLPKDWTWIGKAKAMSRIEDQGACGSCWAIGAQTVLSAHAELYNGAAKHFSTQQLLSCTPNPNECGGKGGCDGATAELAMDHILHAGLMEERDFPYTATTQACPSSVKTKMVANELISIAGDDGVEGVGLIGYQTLPHNKLAPLLDAVYNKGPVAVAIAAASGFSWYFGGVFDSCDSFIANHLLVMVGYGEMQGKKYWQLQNSWGQFWGDRGYVKVIRKDDEEEQNHCGWDTKPEEGNACKGGPPKVWVCGSCAILFSNVVPIFKQTNKGWFANQRNGKSV